MMKFSSTWALGQMWALRPGREVPMPYGTVPTQEGAPFMVRRDGDDYSAVEAGSVASSNSDEKTADGPDNHNEMVV